VLYFINCRAEIGKGLENSLTTIFSIDYFLHEINTVCLKKKFFFCILSFLKYIIVRVSDKN
jgi:hypothetical protein